MSVAELIAALSAAPPDAQITIVAHEDGEGVDCLTDIDIVTVDAEMRLPKINLYPSASLVTAESINSERPCLSSDRGGEGKP